MGFSLAAVFTYFYSGSIPGDCRSQARGQSRDSQRNAGGSTSLYPTSFLGSCLYSLPKATLKLHPTQSTWPGTMGWVASFCGGGQRRQLLAGALHPPLQLRSLPCAALPPPRGPGSPRERAGLGQRAKAGHISPSADAGPRGAAGYAVSC